MEDMREAFYGNIDPRRRQEISDARMIQEDHSKISNLSDRFIHKQYNPDRFKFDQNSAPRPYAPDSDLVEGK